MQKAFGYFLRPDPFFQGTKLVRGLSTMASATLGMTTSYNSNSFVQKVAVQSSIRFIQQAIDAFDVTTSSSSPLIIADFGSSQGLNSIYAMKSIIEYLRETKKDMRDPLIVHNDLPTNDWISLFQLLIEDNSYRAVASGRSFYEKCLPKNSLSIGYSSSSIHWLSKKPCNVSTHCYVGFAQDPQERAAFKHQAYVDYCQFLQYRSRELVPGGVLILTILCVNEKGKNGLETIQERFYKCAQLLPMTPQELLDCTIPWYFRSHDECVNEELFAQCSFELIKSDFVSVKSPLLKQWQEGQITLDEFVRLKTLSFRTATESILQQTLINNGRSKEEIPQVLNQFWSLYEQERPELDDVCLEYLYLILKKKSKSI